MNQRHQKKLQLFLPDWSFLDQLWKSHLPIALWPVGKQPLLFHWMDWAVRQGIATVEIATADRPAEIRQSLGSGHYWSREVKVTSLRVSEPPDEHFLHVKGLPEGEAKTPADARQLLQQWWQWNVEWLDQPRPDGPRLEKEHIKGVWIEPGVRIHPTAQLTPPVWIGTRSEIGKSCRIGPYALIGSKCVVDEDVVITQSMLQAGSYAGRHIALQHMIADGGILLDTNKGIRVDIPEAFVLSRPDDLDPPPSWLSRSLAGMVWLLLALPALTLRGATVVRPGVVLANGDIINVAEGSRGPLLLRRWSWLPQIIRGRFHWFGVLPRSAEALMSVPAETGQRIHHARTGIFSLADVHGVHHPNHEEEWVHAAYQALADTGEMRKMLLKSTWTLLTKIP